MANEHSSSERAAASAESDAVGPASAPPPPAAEANPTPPLFSFPSVCLTLVRDGGETRNGGACGRSHQAQRGGHGGGVVDCIDGHVDGERRDG